METNNRMTKYGLIKVVLLILLMSLLLEIQGQPPVVISGTIIDNTSGAPLIGANVYMKSDLLSGSMTDQNGQFNFDHILKNQGDTLIISYIGYLTYSFSISSQTDFPKTFKITRDIQQIPEITIKAESLIAEEFTIETISSLEVYKNPNAKADPLLAVNSLPASSTLDESANISLRGSSPAETGILFNNVPLYDAVKFSQLNGIGTFSIFNTAMIKQINVFPGNPPLEFGNTTSGLIAIESTDQVPKKPTNSAIVSLASIGINMSRKVKENSAILLFSNYQPSLFLTKLNQKALNRLKQFTTVDFGLHYHAKIGENKAFKLFNYSIVEGYKFQFIHPTFQGIFDQDKKRNFTIANFRARFKDSEITINQGLSFSNTNFQYSNTAIKLNNRDLFSSVNYQYYGKHMGIKSGISYDNRQVVFDGVVPLHDFAIGEDHPIIGIQNTNTVIVPEVYGYLKYNFSPSFTIGTGIRKRIALNEKKDNLSYQLNVHFNPHQKHQLHASAGRYHKHVLAGTEFQNNTLIESRQASIDYKFKGRAIEQHLSLFVKKVNYSAITSVAKGIEFFTNFKFSTKFKGRISYTFIDNKLNDGESTYSSKYDLNYIVKGNITYEPNNFWSFATNFSFRQGSYFNPIDGANFDSSLNVYNPITVNNSERIRHSDYKLVDLSISRITSVSDNLTMILFASIGNVFNFKNVRAYEYNFDYSLPSASFYSQRVGYIGAVLNF